MDWSLAIAGLLVGLVVGMTGMGGGALMTPVLVLMFQVPPLTAVSNDLVVSALMKPVGGAVHLRRGTVHLGLVKYLTLGSVPMAFLGVTLLQQIGSDESVQRIIRLALGAALLLAAAGIVIRAYVSLIQRTRPDRVPRPEQPDVAVRRVRTVLIGAVAGLVVGVTSVGSGSLVVVALLALYPMLRTNRLVGTDIVQAVPLVTSAAIAHLMFGDFHLDITTPLVVGALPGVYLGARLSATVPEGIVRRALTIVLTASGLKLLGVPTEALGWILLVIAIGGSIGWMAIRRRRGLPALARTRASRPAQPSAVNAEAGGAPPR
ncbi:MAG: sulfite exporter TauE/SafE family protein [Sporichthyaceae bacterium]|nr:sulfite exporter TauE/SafE family protein [Sporichthyaceae bacterium]